MKKLSYTVSVMAVLVCVAVNMTYAQGEVNRFEFCTINVLYMCSYSLFSILAGTLGIYLNGVAYPDGATVLRTDIGEGDNALQCTTDSNTCCRNSGGETRAGEVYMPDGNLVLIQSTTTNGYYRTRGYRHILLNRQPTGTITGQFRCNIPQASGPDVDLYINIGKNRIIVSAYSHTLCTSFSIYTVDILVTIMSSGDNTAGDSYSLMCSTRTASTVTGQPTITWLEPSSTAVPSEMVSVMGDVYTLTFNPLAASDAGTYTCRAMIGNIVETAEMTVTVQSECSLTVFYVTLSSTFDLSDPKVVIVVSGDVTPTVGMMLTLTCNVSGADMITSHAITYQWSRNGMAVSDQTQQTWSFSSLTFSDAGQYSCAVDISSNILPSTISAMSALFNITLSCKLWH